MAARDDDDEVRCKTDFQKECVISNFEKRGWVNVGIDSDWHFYWASVGTVRAMFSAESGIRLADNQIVNHFPNHYELTRKDMMLKNIKRYRKELVRDNHPLAARAPDGTFLYLDFIPTTYTLPADYHMFVEEFRRSNAPSWIMKPAGGSQGTGIFLINKLSQIKKWSKDLKPGSNAPPPNVGTYVCSRYIDNPLLIGGKKFDLRIYVLVTSFRPLRVYMHHLGFARFCAVKYESPEDNLDDMFMHLTNVAVQKNGEEYNDQHGGKWTWQNLLLYLAGTRGQEASDQLAKDLKFLVLHALFSVANVIINDRHCYECYGYDIIVDENLKPWLVEINASPSLSGTTRADRILKHILINDIIELVLPPGFPDPRASKGGVNTDPQNTGGFELLYDGSVDTPLADMVPERPVHATRSSTPTSPSAAASTAPRPLSRSASATGRAGGSNAGGGAGAGATSKPRAAKAAAVRPPSRSTGSGAGAARRPVTAPVSRRTEVSVTM